MNPINNQEDIL